MKNRLLTVFIIFVLIIQSSISYAYIPLSDTENHWAKKTIEKWLDSGLITDSKDSIIPDEPMTKIQTIMLINRVLGLNYYSQENYSEEFGNYAKDMAIAKTNGYIDCFNSEESDAYVTRSEVFSALLTLLRFDSSKVNSENQFSDWKEFDNSTEIMIGNGYVEGYPDGTCRPKSYISEAEAIVLLDRILGKQIDAPGTYGPNEGTQVVDNNLTIRVGGTTIQNMEIKGDLILTAGIGEGEVYLNHVVVDGQTVIAGGGENSIHISNSTIKKMIVIKKGNSIRIVSVDSKIGKVVSESSGKLEGDFDGAQIFVIESGDGLDLDGDFDSVTVSTEAHITITADTTINHVTIDNNAEGSTVSMEESSTVKEFEFNSSAEVSGQGTIQTAVVNADGVVVESPVEEKITTDGVDSSEVAIIPNTTTHNENNTQPTFVSITDGTGDQYYHAGEPITFVAKMNKSGFQVSADLSVLDSDFSNNQLFTDNGDGTYSYTTPNLNINNNMKEGSIQVTVTAKNSDKTVQDNSLVLFLDKTPPSGYNFDCDYDKVQELNENAFSFTFSNAEIGTTYYYSFNDSNDTTQAVTGSGVITSANEQITNIDLRTLQNGALTISVYLVDEAGNNGTTINKSVEKKSIIPSKVDTAQIDDDNNLITWDYRAPYNNFSDYEYTLDNGTTWVTAPSKPIIVGNINTGIAGIRIKANAALDTIEGVANMLGSFNKNKLPPNNFIVNDALNTIDFTYSAESSNISDYEYSVDSGATWTTCAGKPQSINDLNYAIGTVLVRAKADITNGIKESSCISNGSAYTITPEQPVAPMNPVVNDALNTFGWTNNPNFTDISDYEYSVDSGTTWNDCSSNPQPVDDNNYPTGTVLVRIKENIANGMAAGLTLDSDKDFTVTPPQPAAPTIPVVDDVNNTFGWTFNHNFTDISDYEYSLDGGTTWQNCDSNPQSVGDNDYPAGTVKVRVKQNTTNGMTAGLALVSDTDFVVTPAQPDAPTNPIVDDALNTFGWTYNPLFTDISQYEYSVDSGTTWQNCNANPQTISDNIYETGAVCVRIKYNSTNGMQASLALSSDAGYTVTPAQPEAPTNPIVDDVNNTYAWTNNPNFDDISLYEYSVDNGATWNDCDSNPQTINDDDYPTGTVLVRIKYDTTNGRPASLTLASNADFTVTPPQPDAPTNPIVNDVTNTFGWTNNPNFTDISDYEYSVDSGTTWSNCDSNPQSVDDTDYAIGSVMVRVKQNTTNGMPAGLALASDAVFTVTPAQPFAPTNPVCDDSADLFDFTYVDGFSDINLYELSTDNGTTWANCTLKPVQVGDKNIPLGEAKIRVKGNSTNGMPAGQILSSDIEYTLAPGQDIVITGNTYGVIQVGEASVTATTGESGATGWQSSDTSKLTINSTTGVINAVAHGDVIISYTNSNSGRKNSLSVTVYPTANTGSVNLAATVNYGSTTTATANSAVPDGEVIEWKSSNGSIATIDASGIITPQSRGTVTISYCMYNTTTGVVSERGQGSIQVKTLAYQVSNATFTSTEGCNGIYYQSTTINGKPSFVMGEYKIYWETQFGGDWDIRHYDGNDNPYMFWKVEDTPLPPEGSYINALNYTCTVTSLGYQ